MASATTTIERALAAAAGGDEETLSLAVGSSLARGFADRLSREAAARLEGVPADTLDRALKQAAYRRAATLKPSEDAAPAEHTLIPAALLLRLLRTDPLRPGLEEPPDRLTEAVYFMTEEESLREHFDLPGYISYFVDPTLYAPRENEWADPRASHLYLNNIVSYVKRGGGPHPRLIKRRATPAADFTVGDSAGAPQTYTLRVLCVTLIVPEAESDDWARYLFDSEHPEALAHVGEMAALDLSPSSPIIECVRLSELWRVPAIAEEVAAATTPANLEAATTN